LGKYA
jgi:hypothetical protein